VLVTGESGTGKELIARMLHELGPNPSGPFVAVNCGALPRELAESELFGHERGAFTGAGARRAGWFEEASGGTLVLDEVGELPLDLQPKLLRVLETGRLRRVGGAGEIAVRVRVVAMTLRDLQGDVARRCFRDDLYYRLAGLCLRMPPLRERRGDIPLLAAHFLCEIAREVGERRLDASAMTALSTAVFPGNVRELRNTIRRAAILSSGRGDGRIDADALELPPSSAFRLAEGSERDPEAGGAASTESPPSLPDDAIRIGGRTFDEIEREVFVWALRRNDGSRRRAARALRVARSTFCDKVKRYGL
jgi:transcriptional regulator with GAF, ATPase, and Fis domain